MPLPLIERQPAFARIGEIFQANGKTWIVKTVNNRKRPLSIQEVGAQNGIYFGSAAAWRGWLSGDWRYV